MGRTYRPGGATVSKYWVTLLNDPARCVVLHVVEDGRLGDCERGQFQGGDAKEQKKDHRNEQNTGRDQTAFHKISIAPGVIGMNLND